MKDPSIYPGKWGTAPLFLLANANKKRGIVKTVSSNMIAKYIAIFAQYDIQKKSVVSGAVILGTHIQRPNCIPNLSFFASLICDICLM